jgi:hypothetical protein
MPEAAYEAYRHAFDRIESIGRSEVVQRPPGVVLAVETRTRPVGADRRDASHVERYSVYAVEETALADSLFQIPRSYRLADPAAAESESEGADSESGGADSNPGGSESGPKG